MKKYSPNNDTSNITKLLDSSFQGVFLAKKKAFDADPRAIQKIVFTGSVQTKSVIYYIAEKSKETVLKFYKGVTKVL